MPKPKKTSVLKEAASERKETLSLRLETKVIDALDVIATAERRTRSAQACIALEDWLSKHRNGSST